MTIEDLEKRIDAIRAMDDEDAHAAEDKLYADVLRAIASGADNAASLAAAALKTKELDFSRWYA